MYQAYFIITNKKFGLCGVPYMCDSVFGDSQGYYNYLKLSPAKD